MYPATAEFFEYVGHRESTEEEKRRGRETVDGFVRCFLPPGAKITLRSEKRS